MNVLLLLRRRFTDALVDLVDGDRLAAAELAEMVRPSQDAKFGDYQANCAMPLGKRLGRPPRDVAVEIVERLDVADLCAPPEIAGPGFINLRLRDDWLADHLADALADEARLGVARVAEPRIYVIDYASPNVAKPMHVGHIRSTVIGDSLCRLLRFLGHTAISDNHIGDWGTQFGMILYGYKHFLDRPAYERAPVEELSRLYRLVRQLVDYHEGRQRKLPELQQASAAQQSALEERRAAAEGAAEIASGKKDGAAKKEAKAIRKMERDLAEIEQNIAKLSAKLAAVEADARLAELAAAHPQIGQAVLEETARLHEGDAENVRLWREFLPPCLAELDRTFDRLGVTFDHALGESFYHERLAPVVADLRAQGLAEESDGAICVFFEEHKAPLIVQKQDGAFLYATTDLATIEYRMEAFQPDAILYVVDHRQSLHFQQLFAAAHRWGHAAVELTHVSFGTVLGEDGRPFQTRAGDTVGLDSLLDEAVDRAQRIVSENDERKPQGGELSADERRGVAEAVGIGALKYADLAHNRTSDYVFSYDKMLAMNGNTATYMQYAHARVRSIFQRGNVDVTALRAAGAAPRLDEPAERALGLELLRLEEVLTAVAAEYRPNLLTNYLFALAERYSQFYEACPVLKAESDAERTSRLILCDLVARTLSLGLELLGIEAVERM